MMQFMARRRLELQAYAQGDQRFQPPATGILVDGKPTRPGQWTSAHLFIDTRRDGKRE